MGVVSVSGEPNVSVFVRMSVTLFLRLFNIKETLITLLDTHTEW